MMNEPLMEYIDINPIVEVAKELNCPFIGIIGGKGTGKTYGCIDYAIRHFFADGKHKPFVYARRYDKTFTANLCGNLVNKHRQDIINLSGGQFNAAPFYGKIYSVCREQVDQKSGLKKSLNKIPIAYCRSLNNVETETGDDKGEISCIIYDEFLTRNAELRDEFNKIMVLHNNATRNRTTEYIPTFLLGNTVSRDSVVAQHFGIRLRDLKRGLNIITNTKGQARIVLYYTPETSKNVEAADTYYDRFENDRINMISRGDWVLGSYKIAPVELMNRRGTTFKFYHNRVAVNVTVLIRGYNPIVVVKKPSESFDFKISPATDKGNLQLIPRVIIDAVKRGNMYAETAEIGEDFRDICKHLVNGADIVNAIE